MSRIPKKHSKPSTGPLASADVLISGSHKAAKGRENLELYRLFFESGPLPIWIFDPASLRFLAVNDAMIRHYGYSREELLALTMKDIRPAEDVAGFLEYVAGAPNLPPRVWRDCKKDGTTMFVEVTMQPVALGKGKALLALGNDVTARIGAEETRRRAETSLLIAQRAAHLGNWDWNIETGELYWSKEIYRLFGIPETPAGVSYETLITGVHPDDRERVERAMREALARRDGYDLDHRVVRPDGTVRIVHEQAEVTGDTSGNTLRMVGTVQDVTERRLAEQVLRRTQRLLDEGERVGQMGSWSYDLTRNEITWSDQLYRLFGVSPESFQPTLKRIQVMIHPDERAEFFRNAKQALRTLQSFQSAHRVVRADGQIRILWQRVLVEGDPRRKPIRIYGTAQDITDLRAAQAQLAEAQRVARIGSWNRDMRTGQVTWSEELYRIFGVSAETFTPKFEMLLAMVHPDDRERYSKERERAFIHGEPYQQVFRIVRADGQTRVLRNHIEVEKDGAGNTLRVFGSSQDITELWEAEEQARKQASLLNLTHDAILVRDLEDRLTFWNRGAEQLYGWKKEEVLGRPVTEFLYGDIRAFDKAKQAVLRRGEWNGELRQLKNDGGDVVVSSRWTLVRDEQGEATGIIAINSDLTEQKKLEQQFLRAQRLESIGTLASGVAHDLNNVLVPILMVAPLLRSDVSNEDREKFLTIVEASAQRGANIVRQVLTFARGADGEKLLLQPIHLLEEISNIIRGTFPKSITVQASYPEVVSPIEGDPTQLHQVLLNLAVNARDAMPQGGTLTLSVSNMDLDEYYAGMAPGIEPGPYVLMQVGDSGTGIAREIIDKIFDPFFTTKDIGVGTGLGLSTVLGIIKSHGGFVNVYSQPGETIFKIFLPAADAAHDLEQPRAAAPIAAGHGEKILIVDDEPGIREIARALLEKHGYEPVVAEDGPAALATFARHPREFTVVLTDMAMPIIDGVTLIRAMRKLNPDIKAILSTGREDEGQAGDIQSLGVQASLTKPYTHDTLFETLHKVLNGE